MDYEKKYKEAWEKATEWEKKYILTNTISPDGTMAKEFKEIFPELTESEDERIRKELKEAFKAYDIESKWNGIPIRSIFDWLEKQKPAEWSEEDEDMLNSCISSIEEAKENRYAYKENDGDTSYDREINWLKSLRPQPKEQDVEKFPEDKSFEDEWKDYYNNSLVSRLPMNKREVARHFYWFAKKNAWKPSEEQMSMLLAVIRDPNNAGSESCFLAFKSLYEDLKKLM